MNLQPQTTQLETYTLYHTILQNSAILLLKCPNNQQVKVEHLKLGGLSQIMDVPTWKWEAIIIDFIVGLPRNQKQDDSILFIVDRITKSANFIPVKSTYKAEDYT